MKIAITLILCLYAFLICACKKLIEVDAPNDRIVTQTVFYKDETATAALTGIYARMHEEGWPSYNIALLTGLYGDELTNYSSLNYLIQIYTNALNPSNSTVPDIWQIAYNHIYNANAVIEGCKESNTIRSTVKRQLIAEGKFIRAFWNFYLTNLYGDIPIITTTDYKTNSVASKARQSEVYNQIINDLKDAEANLNDMYVDGSSESSSNERIRPNRSTATAFLARIYLYINDYTNAELKSSEVIDKTETYNLEQLQDVFLITSKEAIWQIMIPLSTAGPLGSTPEGRNFILTTAPESGSERNCTISDDLLNSFETNDLRKTNWVNEYKDLSVTPIKSYYYPFKYKRNDAISASSEFTTPFRLAEQYLIRAEARAHIGSNLVGARNDLYIIRNRAGLTTSAIMTQSELLTAILHERRHEFFAEWGHRWFDLKRTGNADVVMHATAGTKGSSWSSYKLLWPLPLYDIQNNPNLFQNPGYLNQ